MIRGLSHATLWVHDHDEALAFYTEKLGFEVRNDNTLEGFRWLTVGPRDQKELELALMVPDPGPMYDEETCAQLRALMAKGALGAGVFRTDDCQGTYETLSARGVTFTRPPTERPYGIEAVFTDPSGNWFSLTQPRG